MQEELSLDHGASRDKSLTTSDAASKKMAFRLALAKLAIRRQANPGKETMDIYAADLLAMDETNVLSALESLSCRRRAEGETSFPDWATIIEAVEYARVQRNIAERKATRANEEAQELKRRREHPEEYVTTAQVWAEVSARIAAKKSGAA